MAKLRNIDIATQDQSLRKWENFKANRAKEMLEQNTQKQIHRLKKKKFSRFFSLRLDDSK